MRCGLPARARPNAIAAASRIARARTIDRLGCHLAAPRLPSGRTTASPRAAAAIRANNSRDTRLRDVRHQHRCLDSLLGLAGLQLRSQFRPLVLRPKSDGRPRQSAVAFCPSGVLLAARSYSHAVITYRGSDERCRSCGVDQAADTFRRTSHRENSRTLNLCTDSSVSLHPSGALEE